MMQARWGRTGYQRLSRWRPTRRRRRSISTVRPFNLAERYRVPALVMLDECVGHMMERVVIPRAEEIEVVRALHTAALDSYLPYAPEETWFPRWLAGAGYRFHVTA